MNDRLVTLAGALGSLLVLVLLLYQPAATSPHTRPLTTEAGANGYLGLVRWLESQSPAVPVVSLRERFDMLPDSFPTPVSAYGRGHVLLVTYPFTTPADAREIDTLHRWLAAGNTMLVLAALNETPAWADGAYHDFISALEALTDMRFVAVNDEEGEQLTVGDFTTIKAHPLTYTASAEHPLMAGVATLAGETDLATAFWNPARGAALRLATVDGFDAGAAWQASHGNGFIIVSGSATLLSNRLLASGDNARWFSNVLAHHLAPDGQVIFAEFHQGLSDVYDPAAFFGDTRLHTTLLFALTFWLIYIVGSSGRLGRYQPPVTTPRQRDLVVAIGHFLQRKLSQQASGKLLVDNWLAQLTAAGKLPPDEDPWVVLRTMPLIDQQTLKRVEHAYAELGKGRRIKLRELHNTLRALRRSLG